jgi:hypothetical protein
MGNMLPATHKGVRQEGIKDPRPTPEDGEGLREPWA